MARYSFGSVPRVRYRRSRFDLSAPHTTAFSAGKLIPFYIQEVYPGDTFQAKSSAVVRVTSAFLKPVMDDVFIDQFFFYVPSRLLYDKWSQIFGDNKTGYWAPTQETEVPMTKFNIASMQAVDFEGTIADYLGIVPRGTEQETVYHPTYSDLPFRAYAMIWNEYFRDENLQSPVDINFGEISDVNEQINTNGWNVNNYHGFPAPVSKYKDYFTSCLPAPQKGNAVDVPLNSLRVVTSNQNIPDEDMYDFTPLRFKSMLAGSKTPTDSGVLALNPVKQTGNNSVQTVYSGTTPTGVGAPLAPANLVTQSDGAGFSVNDMRFAFQYQKMLEKDARGGTRPQEYILSHFGVFAGDSRLDRPEFLGGSHTPLNVMQVAQTSKSEENSPLADVGAFSLTNPHARWSKSFVEHGYVIGVCCVRQRHTYSQGIERFWLRSKRTDFYDPVFSNIGEQPVYTRELYDYGNFSGAGDQIFGYNEAWADLRYKPGRVSGKMRPQASGSLAIWNFSDNYASFPTLVDNFIRETPANIDRALAVPSTSAPQFIAQFYVHNIATRVLPTYSVPGLIDHH